ESRPGATGFRPAAHRSPPEFPVDLAGTPATGWLQCIYSSEHQTERLMRPNPTKPSRTHRNPGINAVRCWLRVEELEPRVLLSGSPLLVAPRSYLRIPSADGRYEDYVTDCCCLFVRQRTINGRRVCVITRPVNRAPRP